MKGKTIKERARRYAARQYPEQRSMSLLLQVVARQGYLAGFKAGLREGRKEVWGE